MINWDKETMKSSLPMLYAREDLQYLASCTKYLDIAPVEIRQTQEIHRILNVDRLDRVLLLMSVDLLHFLVFDVPDIYKRLIRLAAEDVVIIIRLRACAWPDHFARCTALPRCSQTLIEFRGQQRKDIWQQITAEIHHLT